MNRKLKYWLETKGRRLIELKLAGCSEYFAKVRDIGKMETISAEEWVEFIALTGEMDALLWVLQPKSSERKEKFKTEVKNFLIKIESQILEINEITGQALLPKGEA